MKTVLIVGLGRYGTALARALASTAVHVIAIDDSKVAVDSIKDDVEQCVACDVRDREVLETLCADGIDLAVVAISQRLEKSVLATMILKELGVPQVLARASSEDHAKLLRKVGADDVLVPITESAERLALRLASPHLLDFVLLNENFAIVELPVEEEMAGQSLSELRFRQRFGVTVIAIRVPTESDNWTIRAPDPETPLELGARVLLIGRTEDLGRFDTKG